MLSHPGGRQQAKITGGQIGRQQMHLDRVTHGLAIQQIYTLSGVEHILGHARIFREVPGVRIATGEQCHNRVMFKQFLQAQAIDACQIESCTVSIVSGHYVLPQKPGYSIQGRAGTRERFAYPQGEMWKGKKLSPGAKQPEDARRIAHPTVREAIFRQELDLKTV